METQTQQNGSSTVASPSTSTALVLRPAADLDRYVPRDLEELRKLAKDAHLSKLTRAKNPEQAQMQMMTGHELGIAPMASLRMVYIADFGQGEQPTVSADGMRAACLYRKDICKYFRTVELTEEKAIVETWRVGDPEPVQRQFTQEDARRAKLGEVGANKDKTVTNWAKYPRMMLRHRADAELAREVYPDILGGMYTPEEASEIAAARREERDVTPLPSASATGTNAAPSSSRAPAGPVDAELVDSNEERIVRALAEATDKPAVDAVAKEAMTIWPKARPKTVSEAHAAAKKRLADAALAAAAAAASAPKQEEQPQQAAESQREPGSDDA